MTLFRHTLGNISVCEIAGFGYEQAWPVIRRRYASIDGIAHMAGYHRHILISPQGRLVACDRTDPGDHFWQAGLYTSYEVYDEDDVLVPARLVVLDVASFHKEASVAYEIRCWKRRGWPKAPREYFRNGPLPGAGKRLWRPKDYKRIGTYAEVRSAAALEADLRESRFPVKIRGKRSRSLIGDNDWEGVRSMRSKDRSWKRHRAAQWKN
jgi:hypothetical protein